MLAHSWTENKATLLKPLIDKALGFDITIVYDRLVAINYIFVFRLSDIHPAH